MEHYDAIIIGSGQSGNPLRGTKGSRCGPERRRDRKEVIPFLRRIYPKLLSLHGYLYEERDPANEGLVYIRHPWESGIDNSPAWDVPLQAIKTDRKTIPLYQRRDLDHVSPEMRPSDDEYDRYVVLLDLFRRHDYDEASIRAECPFLIQDPLFNSILCRADRSMVRIAESIGELPGIPMEWEKKTAEGIRRKLWCRDNRMFYPFDMVSEKLIYAETSSEVIVFPEEKKVLLSEIFRWYERDFGGPSGVIGFLCRYLVAEESREYLRENASELSFEYLFYDWDLNRRGRS